MILTAFWHGLRASEVTGFQRDAIRDGYLDIQRLKGSLRTVQPLVEHPDPLFSERAALIEYAEKSSFGRPVFDITREHFTRLVKKYGIRAGIPRHKCHAHALKHTIASLTVHSAGLENVRQHLGHKSISSTGEYVRVGDEQASKAVTDAIKGV